MFIYALRMTKSAATNFSLLLELQVLVWTESKLNFVAFTNNSAPSSSKRSNIFLLLLWYRMLKLVFFLPVSHCCRAWSKINFKVYGVINCLTKNLLTHIIWYFEKEKRYDIEALPIDRILNKEHFYGKSCRKHAPKAPYWMFSLNEYHSGKWCINPNEVFFF